MEKNMKKWVEEQIACKTKKAVPVLSFPAITLMGITVKELITDSGKQAEAMRLVAQKVDTGAAVSLMDLSVEAEAFGSKIRVSDDEVPTVIGSVISTLEEAEALPIPKVGAGRTGLYIDAIKKATQSITDRPVFAGCIGPFSLSGRLMDVSEIMVNCYMEPEMVRVTLEKATRFIIDYIKGYKEAGANGIIMAEPLAGLLSPDLIEEFSSNYVRKISDAVKDDNFLFVYHNCGNNVIALLDSIKEIGADIYHFGNAPQFIFMKGFCALSLLLTMISAISSFPVPDSPEINTVESPKRATRWASSTDCKKDLLWAMILPIPIFAFISANSIFCIRIISSLSLNLLCSALSSVIFRTLFRIYLISPILSKIGVAVASTTKLVL